MSATIADVLTGRARWSLVEADCLEVMPLLPDRSVAHVITDPPYSRDLYLRFRTNKGSHSGDGKQSPALLALANEAIGAMDDVLPAAPLEFARLASRWIVVFHDAESGHLWREPLGERYVRSGVWVKPNPMPQISRDRPGQGFESATIAHAPGRKRWNGGGRAAVWSHNAENSQSSDRGVMGHPCPKPLTLMLELIEQFTDPDDVVLDPFCGSGTTGAAALRLGRRFIGIEKSPQYAALARERLSAESVGLSLRDARAGQAALFSDADLAPKPPPAKPPASETKPEANTFDDYADGFLELP